MRVSWPSQSGNRRFLAASIAAKPKQADLPLRPAKSPSRPSVDSDLQNVFVPRRPPWADRKAQAEGPVWVTVSSAMSNAAPVSCNLVDATNGPRRELTASIRANWNAYGEGLDRKAGKSVPPLKQVRDTRTPRTWRLCEDELEAAVGQTGSF